jgi:hypothetical protein
MYSDIQTGIYILWEEFFLFKNRVVNEALLPVPEHIYISIRCYHSNTGHFQLANDS